MLPVVFMYSYLFCVQLNIHAYIRGSFEKLVDWWQCAAVMRKEA